MAGEVVFNTGMVGYPESLTDPSYRGQILVLTYPMVGNYGVPGDETLDSLGLPAFLESYDIHIAGLVVSSYSVEHSHWNSVRSLGEWLASRGVPAMYGVDTRALTKVIRNHGSLLGKIEFEGQPVEFANPNERHLVAEVSTRKTTVYGKGNATRILAFDCGMKYNIIRCFAEQCQVEFTVVPFDYDLEANVDGIQYDGVFVSNGPGDPVTCAQTINSLKWLMAQVPCIPIFGICLGNQLLALAAGGSTYKMKFGNRGMNQPAIDMRTSKCYITPQNHGYAVDAKSLPEGWKTFFVNANDFSNEGIIHETKPWSSVQFHPEAAGGPMDTNFLFATFIGQVRGESHKLTLLEPHLFETQTVKKVLLLGSGGLSIGQAGEFDYSGSQAIKALKEEGLEVVLINPNIATVQTSKNLGGASPDRTYFLPVKPDVVEEVIKKERPDGIVVSMGGQTALNVGVTLYNSGVLKKYNVKVLGTPIASIIATEDRDEFAQKLNEIGEKMALSYCATTLDEGLAAAKKIGFPVLIRAAFALGGLGSGFAETEEEFLTTARKAFSCSDQIIIDQDLRGWKEVEYEVVRDNRDNCITVCNMENFDPLGVHTGDSIVVAPSQTLSNSEYFKLRLTALKVVRHLGIVGECNIQYALNPHSEEYCIIEVNARLSRSSALASKATGYPLAYVAAKLALGKDLVSIRNSVTKSTTACFEPSLDYCVVKMPRWDLKKFSRVSTRLGSSMTSVGEVMAIGRTFEEAIQKAVRMVDPGSAGLEGEWSMDPSLNQDDQLRIPTDQRLFAVMAAMEDGRTVDDVHNLSRIDRWFLAKLRNIALMRKAVKALPSPQSLNANSLRTLKCAGFSDLQLARYMSSKELEVRALRQSLGVTPRVKQIDTLAAEFPAATNYLYMTYSGSEDDIEPENQGIMVLGCGAYCIGSSVEFDWCAVSCVRQLRTMGYKAIVVNFNPETVSTDYDESDRLYFEELSFERVMDIYEWEAAAGVVVSVGGQIPQNIAMPLHLAGATVLGTRPEDIDRAEDRDKFSAMLDSIGVDQPEWSSLTSIDEALIFADRVGFPCLVRPSFVLSGAAMAVASTAKELADFLRNAGEVANDKPVVISKFIEGAKEIEFDGVSQGGNIINYAISEHVENAGVHSGDATLLLPAQKLWVETIRRVKRVASAICKALNISGPFNIQLMARENEIKVIECNLRASRTFPFISKTLDANFITLATKVMLGMPVKPYRISLLDIDYVAVKAPMFSFTRLRGADPTLGVEMASTGEVACFGRDSYEAFLQALRATNFTLPSKDKEILISFAEDRIRAEFLPWARELINMGYKFCGTPGTAAYYEEHGVSVKIINKPAGSTSNGTPAVDGAPMADEYLKQGSVDLVINIPEGTKREDEITSGYLMRRTAVDFGVGLLTNVKCATLLVDSLLRQKDDVIRHRPPVCIEEYYGSSNKDAM
ncbi:multifunctional pyrimidine synthesis protein [Tribonema minus]|uniref:Multifunctional pyrimidine synthesis protein n=1 Tax=Tribonema minus TaxID=303371 RepID=A0A836CIG0_9STRA|nr:multifunctional pyrimidine synthesis protein [Tribonema minus]